VARLATPPRFEEGFEALDTRLGTAEKREREREREVVVVSAPRSAGYGRSRDETDGTSGL